MTDEVFFDPNQLETVRRRSECLDFMRDTMKRGGGIHEGDAQILTQLVSNLYSVLPVENAEQVAVGDSMREDREAYLRRIR
ncbi:MAG: hypothetical protein JRM77_10200, partial [Nitrososphaerota archaeon]|nr:hypothetical protein [Nitrososphaerota archaeon]